MRFTDDDIRADMERAIEAAGGLRKFSDQVGLSATFISQVRHGRTTPGPKLAAHLGYRDDGKRWVKDVRE